MNPLPWTVPWLVARVVAGSALTCAAVAQPPIPANFAAAPAAASAAAVAPAERITMAEALDAAWSRSLEYAESSGRQRRVQAEQAVAGSWLAATPMLEMAQREGQSSAANGRGRETEVGVALPLWRPGQRQLNGQAAEAESVWAAAAERAARWRLAAQLREQAARWRVAETEARQAAQQGQMLNALATDVDRRVKAGDLAPADALAAKAELLAARAQDREAQQVLQSQRASWLLLTGMAALPEAETLQSPQGIALDHHPEVVLADAAVQRARQRVAQVQSQRAAPPELGLSLRRERPGLGQPGQNSAAVSVRLPFGGETHSRPQLAAALAEQDLALASQQRMRQQLASELGLAHSGLASVTDQAAAEAEGAALLRERAQLLNTSFLAGESALPDVLRALGAASQAEATAARRRAALALADARLQQALGLLP